MQGIQYCIENGLARFEGGAQGVHKMSRGMLPTPTWSAHWVADPRFAHAISEFLDEKRRRWTSTSRNWKRTRLSGRRRSRHAINMAAAAPFDPIGPRRNTHTSCRTMKLRDFFNLYSHDFARVAVGVPPCRVADPAFNAAETIDLASRRRRTARCWSRFRNSACRPIPATTCSTSAPCSTPAKRRCGRRGGVEGAVYRDDRRHAAARRPYALQLRDRGRGRQDPRRRAEELSAELRRVLRSAPVQPGR